MSGFRLQISTGQFLPHPKHCDCPTKLLLQLEKLANDVCKCEKFYHVQKMYHVRSMLVEFEYYSEHTHDVVSNYVTEPRILIYG